MGLGVFAVNPQAALAQLPNCEPFPPGAPHTKTDSPDPVIQGNDLYYTIALTPFASPTCFRFEDPLPVGTTFLAIGAAAGWTCSVPPVGSHGTVRCSIGPTFGPQVLTLVVRVDPGFSGTLQNVGTVSVGVNAPFPPFPCVPAPICTVAETTTVDVPVELIGFSVE